VTLQRTATGMVLAAAIGCQAGLLSANAADLPSDVMSLIGRRAGCEDMVKRGIESASGSEALQCNVVAQDELSLREKYAGDPEVLRALDGTWVKVVRRVGTATLPPDAER
jgi:hypothetical protein